MGYFIAGLFLGLVAGWFWFYQLKGGGGFQKILGKEIGQGNCLHLLDEVKQRMEYVEERCRLLEDRIAGLGKKKGLRAAGAVEKGGPCNKQERALLLWEKGCEITEVIRQTGLSKGEIELILSLQGHH